MYKRNYFVEIIVDKSLVSVPPPNLFPTMKQSYVLVQSIEEKLVKTVVILKHNELY